MSGIVTQELSELVLHGGNTTWPIQIQHGGPQPISTILHIENQLVCGIEVYNITIKI